MSTITQLLPFLLMFVVFYFFFIRPQAKKQKEQNNFINNLQKGEEIVTMSGIVGKISKVEDLTVQLEVEGKTFIKFTKTAVSKEMTDAYKKSMPVA
jgi:preprotein translocase subunit YajC